MPKREAEAGNAPVEPVLGDEEAAALKNLPNYKDPGTAQLIEHWTNTFGTVSNSDKPVKITEQCLVCKYARALRGEPPNQKMTCTWHSGHDAEHDRRAAAASAG